MSPGGGETRSVGWRKGLQHQHSVPQAEGVYFLLLIGALGGHWPGTPGQGVAAPAVGGSGPLPRPLSSSALSFSATQLLVLSSREGGEAHIIG